jgi:protocatechuate 3,4-dioxygenase beta subunit
MHKAIVAVVALLATAAAALLLWMGTGHEASPAPSATGTPATLAAASPAASPAAAALPAAVGGELAADGDGSRMAAPDVGAQPLPASILIRGRLVDGNGAPRSGVDLRLRTWEAGHWFGYVPPRSNTGDGRPTWKTATDGAFALPLARGLVGALELPDSDLVFAVEPEPVTAGRVDQDLGTLRVLRASAIRGVVQDERGQPAAGVKVTASLGALALGQQRSMTSGADGSFAFHGLRGGTWLLRAASDRHQPTMLDIDLQPEERRDGLVLVVRAGNAIAGQVVDDRGIGVAGMRVGAKRKEKAGTFDIERFSPDEATTTDAHGYFSLSGLGDEPVTVRAFGPGHGSAVAADVPVGTGDLVLRVERHGVIEGVLVGADGAPIAGSRVRAEAATNDGGGPLVIEEFGFVGGVVRGEATTGADGSFRLESVRPGTVAVVAHGKAHRPARQHGIVVRPAQVTAGVRLVADAGATVNVLVLDAEGRPVAGARVTANRVRERTGPGGTTIRASAMSVEDRGEVVIGDGGAGSAVTDDSGRAVLPGLPAGAFEFTATHADHAPAVAVRVLVPRAGAVDASLTLRRPGGVEILVRGADGMPGVGEEVLVRALDGEREEEPQRASSDGEGMVRLTALAPGRYEAAIARPAQGRSIGGAVMFVAGVDEGIAASRRQFTVVAGETTRLEITRPTLARLHGVVLGVDGPVEGASVSLLREGQDLAGFGGRQTTADADGRFAFDDVEPGAYTIEYGRKNQLVAATRTVDVPPGALEQQVELALRTGRVRVQVVAADTGEGVARAEVELVRAEAPAAEPRPRQARQVMMVSMSLDAADGEGVTTIASGAPRALTDGAGIAEIDDVPVGDYTLRIRHKGFAPKELDGQVVVERQLTDCGRVALGAAGQIRGKVVDAEGKPARMALVFQRAHDKQQWSEPTMAAGGAFRMTGLAAGRYRLRAQAIGPSAGGYSPEVEVEVAGGGTATVELKLPSQ